MNAQQRESMLALARQTVEADLADDPLPDVAPFGCEDVDHSGAFVTLKNQGRLRGCMGTFQPAGTLAQTIQKMAPTAAHDPRFFSQPITLDEMDAIVVEISVLSPLVRTDDPLSLTPGVHGILVQKGAARGCFLPQVATETGWDAETFLSQCCSGKAGMAPDAWKDPDADVYLFTAEVFNETDA